MLTNRLSLSGIGYENRSFFFFPSMKGLDTRNIKLIEPCLHLPLAESNSQEGPRSRNTGQ